MARSRSPSPRGRNKSPAPNKSRNFSQRSASLPGRSPYQSRSRTPPSRSPTPPSRSPTPSRSSERLLSSESERYKSYGSATKATNKAKLAANQTGAPKCPSAEQLQAKMAELYPESPYGFTNDRYEASRDPAKQALINENTALKIQLAQSHQQTAEVQARLAKCEAALLQERTNNKHLEKDNQAKEEQLQTATLQLSEATAQIHTFQQGEIAFANMLDTVQQATASAREVHKRIKSDGNGGYVTPRYHKAAANGGGSSDKPSRFPENKNATGASFTRHYLFIKWCKEEDRCACCYTKGHHHRTCKFVPKGKQDGLPKEYKDWCEANKR